MEAQYCYKNWPRKLINGYGPKNESKWAKIGLKYVG